MYAIVEIAGKQYKVSKDDKLFVPKQKAEPKDKLTFDKVLLVNDGKTTKVGTPIVAGVTVKATVLEQVKADKVLVFKKKRRKRYKVKNGHRQPYTQIQIDAVTASKKKAAPKAAAEPKEEATLKAAAKKSTAAASTTAKKATAAKATTAKKPAAKKATAAKATTAKKKAAPKENPAKADSE